jgi:hypothetical protein
MWYTRIDWADTHHDALVLDETGSLRPKRSASAWDASLNPVSSTVKWLATVGWCYSYAAK